MASLTCQIRSHFTLAFEVFLGGLVPKLHSYAYIFFFFFF